MFKLRANKFYYIEVKTKKLKRDNTLSEILDKNYIEKKLYSNQIRVTDTNYPLTDKLYLTPFTKSYHLITLLKKQIDINSDITSSHIITIDRDCFIKAIPDINDVEQTIESLENYQVNLCLKKQEVEYLKELKSRYKCISAYKEPDRLDKWLHCTNCNLQPLVWEFDNGRSTACGCGENEYNHFSVEARSIMSVYKETNSTAEYDCGELRMNWNHWVKSGEHSFKRDLEKERW